MLSRVMLKMEATRFCNSVKFDLVHLLALIVYVRSVYFESGTTDISPILESWNT